MLNMYDQYLYKPTTKDQIGLGIGSLISAALASTRGRNTGDALIRAAAGGLVGYGSGWKGMQDQYDNAIKNALAQDSMGLNREKFAEEKRRYEETANKTSEFNTPGDLDTFLASKSGRFGLDYSNPQDRAKMLTLFGRNDTGLSRQYNKWKPSLAPNIYNVIPGYQTPEGQPKTYNMRTGLPSSEKPLQRTPSEADVKFERDYTTADALLDELETSFEANKDSLPKDATKRITEYPSRMGGKILQTKSGVGLKNLESLRIAIMPKMIRALGEVGTLTDADIARVNQAIPTINDVESVRKKGFQQIRDLIKEVHSRGQRQQNVIPGQVNKPQPTIPSKLTVDKAKEYLIQSGGDRQKAEEMARADGLEF